MLFLLKTFSFLLGHIPLPLSFLIADLLGYLVYKADRKRRNIALDNLMLAYGESITPDEKDRIVRTVFRNLARMFFEFMRIPWLRGRGIDRYIRCEGIENLERALERKKGAIILTGHYGNWELIAAFLGLKGFRMDIVVRDLDNPAVDAFVRWVRTRSGHTIVSKGRAMRTLLKTLNENGIVGILLDQNVALVEGVFVPFFGVQACTNRGTAMMAASSCAHVIPTFIFREGRTHRMVLGREIPLSLTGDKERDALQNTARFTAAIEETIRKKPEDWFWVHRRWKTRPPVENVPGKRG